MNRILSFLHSCFESLRYGIIALSIGFIVFTLLERMFSLRSVKKTWRASLIDLQYALLSMLYPPFINFLLSFLFGLEVAVAAHGARISPFTFALEFVVFLFARDILIYIRHRIFHSRHVWVYHSVHHSSEEVDWISAFRFHPVENMIEAGGELLLFLGCRALGMDAGVLSVASFVIGFYNLFIHSNLRWTFGPLRYVLVSPVFHRWHHSDQPEALDKNFAGMFSCIDLALGTFYMPKDSMPETLGLSEQEKNAYPRTFAGQLLYPFTKR